MRSLCSQSLRPCDPSEWQRQPRKSSGASPMLGAALSLLGLGLGLGLTGCDNSAPQAQVLWTDAVDGQTLTTFTKESPFHLKLSPQRTETVLPAAALQVAPLAVSDQEYGVRLYAALPSDPLWSIDFADFNHAHDVWNQASPFVVRGPRGMKAPVGTDGTVILVDEAQQLAYEMWQFAPAVSGQRAFAQSANIVDLRTSGIHRNVGVSAAGLPGLGGLLRASEMTSAAPIRHKLWLAVHPSLLHAAFTWPASQVDVPKSGASALLRYGDVVALRSDVDPMQTCHLSKAVQKVATALRDYGGLVMDQGGDAVGVVAEVDSFSTQVDVPLPQMYAELACLRPLLTRVENPWDGAVPGGLGF